MRKLVLFVLLVVAIVFALAQKYQIQTGHSNDGKFHMVMVDKSAGKIYQVIGGK